MRLSGAVLPWVSAAAAVTLVGGLIWGFSVPEELQARRDRQDHVPARACGDDGDQHLGDDARHLADLADPPPPRQRARRPRRRPGGRGDDGDRARHRGRLGPADVGDLVGVGPAPDLVPDPVSLLPRLHGALGRDREPRQRGRPDGRAVPRRLGLRAALALCGQFLEPGLHQGATISVAPGDRISSVYSYPLYTCMAGFFLLFLALLLVRTRTEIRRRRTAALLAREVRG